MVSYFLFGIAILVGLLVLARWLADAQTETLLKWLKRIGVAAGLAVTGYLIAAGRFALVAMLLPVILPWLLRFNSLAKSAKNYSRMAGGGAAPTGQKSELRTRYLRVSLDHDTGAMDGEVVAGRYSGRRLNELGLTELLDLMVSAEADDPESAQVLGAYLDRVHPDWREAAPAAGSTQGAGGVGGFAPGAMSRDEALRILGVEPDASPEAIKAAYHRLMAALHPDKGGSTYLAAKLNEAKDRLLGEKV
ncbi:MAG: molecular chaperone DnaJ [Rhodospirillales bacterium]|nr:molecular chaperone DnaJ [Rhodospirillales bacterium]